MEPRVRAHGGRQGQVGWGQIPQGPEEYSKFAG